MELLPHESRRRTIRAVRACPPRSVLS